jgi:hypothetical protein
MEAARSVERTREGKNGRGGWLSQGKIPAARAVKRKAAARLPSTPDVIEFSHQARRQHADSAR